MLKPKVLDLVDHPLVVSVTDGNVLTKEQAKEMRDHIVRTERVSMVAFLKLFEPLRRELVAHFGENWDTRSGTYRKKS